jgi:hypothetical protein
MTWELELEYAQSLIILTSNHPLLERKLKLSSVCGDGQNSEKI